MLHISLLHFAPLALCAALNLMADPAGAPKPDSRQGQLIVAHLASAPFPHPQRAAGRTYEGQFYPAEKHYADNTVAIFIPQGFRESGRVDFVVHFHGWRNSVARALEHHQLIEQFQESRRNALLVLPQGPLDAPDSFDGKLEDPGGFTRFMGEVMVTLSSRSALTNRNSSLGTIILSAHSGGYQVVSSILDHGGLTAQVKEVWLFDALYAGTDKFLAWLVQSHGRLLTLYTDHGGTKEETEQLMATLKQRGDPCFAGKESEVTPAALRLREPIFLHSALDHDAVMQGHRAFQRLLETSELEVLPRARPRSQDDLTAP